MYNQYVIHAQLYQQHYSSIPDAQNTWIKHAVFVKKWFHICCRKLSIKRYCA